MLGPQTQRARPDSRITRPLEELIRVTLMSREQACGNVITEDLLGDRVPMDAMVRLHGDPVKQACAAGTVTNLNRRGRRLT